MLPDDRPVTAHAGQRRPEDPLAHIEEDRAPAQVEEQGPRAPLPLVEPLPPIVVGERAEGLDADRDDGQDESRARRARRSPRAGTGTAGAARRSSCAGPQASPPCHSLQRPIEHEWATDRDAERRAASARSPRRTARTSPTAATMATGREDQQALGRREQQAQLAAAPGLGEPRQRCPRSRGAGASRSAQAWYAGTNRRAAGAAQSRSRGTRRGQRTAMPRASTAQRARRRHGAPRARGPAAGRRGRPRRSSSSARTRRAAARRRHSTRRRVLPEGLAGGPDAGAEGEDSSAATAASRRGLAPRPWPGTGRPAARPERSEAAHLPASALPVSSRANSARARPRTPAPPAPRRARGRSRRGAPPACRANGGSTSGYSSRSKSASCTRLAATRSVGRVSPAPIGPAVRDQRAANSDRGAGRRPEVDGDGPRGSDRGEPARVSPSGTRRP